MADIREAILARLPEICAAVQGMVSVDRNKLDVPNLQRPGSIVQDGSAQFLDQPPSQRRSTEVARFELSPKIVVMVRSGASDSGPLMSMFARRIIVAVLTDATLLSLTRIRLDGLIVPEPTPESREPRVEINFVFTYPFRLSDLSA